MIERAHQDKKWGVQEHPDAAWLMILAEEVGEAAELVLAALHPSDPYWRNVGLLVDAGKKAKEFIGESCDLGAPQPANTPGVEKEAMQITAVGLAWLECMARRPAQEKKA